MAAVRTLKFYLSQNYCIILNYSQILPNMSAVTQTNIYTQIYKQTHTHPYTNKYTNKYIHTQIHKQIHIMINKQIHIHIYIYIGSGQYTLLSGRPVQTGQVLFEFKFTTGIECIVLDFTSYLILHRVLKFSQILFHVFIFITGIALGLLEMLNLSNVSSNSKNNLF